jgi:ATP-dependent Clp protease ATP-binding subunit ClpA
MTTNAGSNESSSISGFGESASQSNEAKVMKSLEAFLRPEFINRVDEIIVFNRLNKENFNAICRIMLSDLKKVLSEKGMEFDYSDSLVDYLVNKGFSEKYGARNLRRLIQTDVEDMIANEIVKNYNDPFKKVTVGIKNDKVTVKTKK